MTLTSHPLLKFFFLCALILNVLTWVYARDIKGRWANVPPVPSRAGAASFALGDQQFAYRVIAIMLQNLGDTGGRSTPLDQYNYDDLAKWFFLEDQLDTRSNYMPFLASYYFGAVQDPQKLPPLLAYLRKIGESAEGERWRWLAHAVYLARFDMKDQDRALELAYALASIKNDKMPHWARQMPVFVLNMKGDKKEALDMMVEMLRSGADTMSAAEINFTRDYICTRILDAAEAAVHPLCQDNP